MALTTWEIIDRVRLLVIVQSSANLGDDIGKDSDVPSVDVESVSNT